MCEHGHPLGPDARPRTLQESLLRLRAAQLEQRALAVQNLATAALTCQHAAEVIRASRARQKRAIVLWGTARRLADEVQVASLTLLPRRSALRGTDRVVPLTTAEWSLLTALIDHWGEVLERSQIATQAWGPGFANRHNEVEVYVCRLRRKLRDAGSAVRIETVRGRGYRLGSAVNGPLPATSRPRLSIVR
jgi:DNA-binding response OmpR family regulator